MEDHTRRFAVREYSNSAENAQETNMFRRFAELALSGNRTTLGRNGPEDPTSPGCLPPVGPLGRMHHRLAWLT